MAQKRKMYGSTWWGNQWLNALEEIDFSNRLPRGHTYASKGAVVSIDIQECLIQARVQGGRPSPYDVQIHLPKFSKKDRNTILNVVSANPFLLSQLLNRRLPQELFSICQKAGIQLFPASWKDLQGSCSCPDWAVPCKHQAAVLYVVANEIDLNPFLLFTLHGFDLIKELENTGLGNTKEREVSITDVEELMEPITNTTNTSVADNTWQFIDFSQIPTLGNHLFSLLHDNPPFYPKGDFKKILKGAYKKLQKYINEQQKTNSPKELVPKIVEAEEVEILLDEDMDFLTCTIRDEAGIDILHLDTRTQLLNWLDGIPLQDYSELSASIRSLLMTYQLACQLVANGAFIPQLLKVGVKGYRVRWIPATLNEIVKDISSQVASVRSKKTVFYRKADSFWQANQGDTLYSLVSIMLDEIVKTRHGLSENRLLEKIPGLFFQHVTMQFSEFSEQSFPGAIQLWLNKFFLKEKKLVPVLKIEDAGSEGFALSVLIEDQQQGNKEPLTLSEIFEDDEHQKIRLSVLRDLDMLVEYMQEMAEVVAAKGRKVLLFNAEAFIPVLFKIIPSIQLSGVKVLLPKALRNLIRPKVSLSIRTTEESTQVTGKETLLNLQEMLQFEWQVAISDQLVPVEVFRKMANEYSGIVRLNDDYVFFNEDDIQKLITQLTNPPEPTIHKLIQVTLTNEYEGAAVMLSPRTRQLMKQLLHAPNLETPKGLQATLRPYQHRGYAWMYKNAKLGFGSLIADDMGLGKTLQVITTLLRLKEEKQLGEKKALIIVPTTLLTNWEKEIARFAPNLTFQTYHGPNRNLKATDQRDLTITTYGVVRSDTENLQQQDWQIVIIDEAQHIKNPNAAQSKAVKKIKAPLKIAMSGTPVENHLSEYWSIFDFVNKGYLGGLKSFMDSFAKPIEVDRDHQRMDHFRKITAPFILRRLKSDKTIIKDLPEKIEKNQFCQLTPEQAALYQTVVNKTMEQIEFAEGITRKGLVLKLLTSLKQVCNHPRQFLKRGAINPAQSGKCLMLFDLLPDILANNGKALIFTQYQEMGKLLQEMIHQVLGFTPPFLHGGLTRKKRDQLVNEFQGYRATRVMILSLKAAGTGLNLTAANHVIHYDLWWNPAVEAQATDRAFRIGQERNVLVHRFITQDTFEEKINELLESKRELANLTVAHGEKWVGNLSNQELKDLFTIGL